MLIILNYVAAVLATYLVMVIIAYLLKKRQHEEPISASLYRHCNHRAIARSIEQVVSTEQSTNGRTRTHSSFSELVAAL